MAKEQIPVYLFTGFLEGGKTTLIQSVLEDPEFNNGARFLLLCCEEGIEEYDPSRFPSKNILFLPVEKETDLTLDLLADYTRQHKIERVIVEYNGMWQTETLFSALPHNWAIFQQLLVADASTFENYNNNMRSLVFDKLLDADSVIFNRAEGVDREVCTSWCVASAAPAPSPTKPPTAIWSPTTSRTPCPLTSRHPWW